MTNFKPYVPGQPITKQPDPPAAESVPEVQPEQAPTVIPTHEPTAADSTADSPDQLHHACQQATYPKRIIWPDGETVYRDGTELYADLWQRSMVKEALTLGGELHAPQP